MTPYYSENNITLFHGDCGAILPRLAEQFDMVFTSPPYNLGTSTGTGLQRIGHYPANAHLGARGGSSGSRKWKRPALANGYGAHSDAMPMDEYIAWQKSILRQLWATLTSSGAIYYNHKPRVLGGELLTPLAYNPDLPLRQIVIWARTGGINFTPAFYLPTCEWIVILAKPDWRLKDSSATGAGAGDVWRIPQENGGNPHPAPFPLALPTRAILTAAPKSVLDPFAGSGTTLVAAYRAGVRGVGIELEERFCEMAAKRLEQEAKQGCLFEKAA